MLEIIKQQSDTHLLLIGPITASWYYDEFLETAEMLNVKERLTVIPGLKPDSVELLQALKTAYCFILPSRHEPFGIAALEALDAQVPLIASAVGGLRDFLCHGENALMFEDNNVAELVNAYDHLPKVKEQLISGGSATASCYNWQNIAAKLTDIYRELLQ